MCGKFLVKMPGAMLKCQDRFCGHTQPENPDAFSERRMSRQEYAQQKYLVKRYSEQKEIKTDLGDLLKKALEKKDV
jgi:DNA topoisomerase-3